jgi:hypothetical protein
MLFHIRCITALCSRVLPASAWLLIPLVARIQAPPVLKPGDWPSWVKHVTAPDSSKPVSACLLGPRGQWFHLLVPQPATDIMFLSLKAPVHPQRQSKCARSRVAQRVSMLQRVPQPRVFIRMGMSSNTVQLAVMHGSVVAPVSPLASY